MPGKLLIRILVLSACLMSSRVYSQFQDAGLDSIFSTSLMCEGDSFNVCVRLFNNSNSGTIDTIIINLEIGNGAVLADTIFNLNLSSSEDTILCYGLYSYSNGDTLLAYLSSYLGINDTNNQNDSVLEIAEVNALPLVDAGGTLVACTGSTIQLGGNPTGPSGSSYIWNNSNLSNQFIANPNFNTSTQSIGTYQFVVEVTDLNNCINTDTALVQIVPLPAASISQVNTIICVGETLNISAYGGYTYQWSPVSTLTLPNLPTTGAFPIVTTSYTVTVTDVNGCSSTATTVVPVHAPVPANAGQDVSMCQQDSVQLNANGGLGYQWNNAGTLSNAYDQSPICSAISTTVYTVTVTDSNNCTGTDQVTVIVHPLPNVGAGMPQTICKKKSIKIGGTPTGPNGSLYQWIPSNSLNFSNVGNPTASPLQTTTYKVIVTTPQGCSDSATTIVYVDTLPVIHIEKYPEAICVGDTTSIAVSSYFELYHWSPNLNISGSSSDSVVVYPKITRDYFVTVTDANGCQSSDTINVKVLALPEPDAGFDIEICEGDTTIMKGDGGVLFTWDNGATLSDSNAKQTLAFPLETTVYTLWATDTNGCMNYDKKIVTVHSRPYAEAGKDIEDCGNESVKLGGDPTGPADAVYYWTPLIGLDDPYSPNPNVVALDRITYQVEVQDQNGCTNFDTIRVNGDCYALIYAPSAFTPGNNGVNDEFKIEYHRIFEPILLIYDRWGRLVFQTNDLDIGWNGNYITVEEDAPAGVYYWELAYKSDTKKKLTKNGTVTLIR